jgi:hypothetical protein
MNIEFTQTERESLIHLLLLALYADSHLSLLEDEVLQEELDRLGWESTRPRELCILNAFAKVREATRSEPDARDAFLRDRAGAFGTAATRIEAYRFINRLISSDGVTSSESSFLEKLRLALQL